MRAVAFIGLLALAAGCASTDLPPVSDVDRFRLEQDEKRVWLMAWQETDEIDRSGTLYDDRELENYLNGITRKLQPPEVLRNIPFAVRIIRDPTLNAFAFPNGAIYVHSGLMAVMESEAQFAALVAHEMTHATHRHAVKELRNEKNKMAMAATLQTVLGGHHGELSARASVAGYSRDLEAEADAAGLALAVAAGYDPQDAVRLYDHLAEEVQEGGISEPFFYGTHPRIQDRVDSLAGLLASRYPGKAGGRANADLFFRRTAGLVLDNAGLDIRAGRFSRAQRSLERFLRKCPPGDARPIALLGDLYRKRGIPGDLELARTQYRKAIETDPGCADAYRGLGLVFSRTGDAAGARASFATYLSLSPQARDRAYIEEYLARQDRKGGQP